MSNPHQSTKPVSLTLQFMVLFLILGVVSSLISIVVLFINLGVTTINAILLPMFGEISRSVIMLYAALATIRPVLGGWYAMLLHQAIVLSVTVFQFLNTTGLIEESDVQMMADAQGSGGVTDIVAAGYFFPFIMLFHIVITVMIFKRKAYFQQHSEQINPLAVPVHPFWFGPQFQRDLQTFFRKTGMLALGLLGGAGALLGVAVTAPGLEGLFTMIIRTAIILGISIPAILFLVDLIKVFGKSKEDRTIVVPFAHFLQRAFAFILALGIILLVEFVLFPGTVCMGISCGLGLQ